MAPAARWPKRTEKSTAVVRNLQVIRKHKRSTSGHQSSPTTTENTPGAEVRVQLTKNPKKNTDQQITTAAIKGATIPKIVFIKIRPQLFEIFCLQEIITHIHRDRRTQTHTCFGVLNQPGCAPAGPRVADKEQRSQILLIRQSAISAVKLGVMNSYCIWNKTYFYSQHQRHHHSQLSPAAECCLMTKYTLMSKMLS